MARPSFTERFWSNVEKRDDNECWPWLAGIHHAGYGVIGRIENGRMKQLRAHRAAYELTHGPIPDGYCVCHRCDNPPCCNPNHLFLGTAAENNTDRAKKGRNGTAAFTGFSTDPPRGDKNRHAKLTPDDVAYLRAEYEAGTLQQRTEAKRLGVHFTTINRIVRSRTWSHLTQ